jgi:hypothetical protein
LLGEGFVDDPMYRGMHARICDRFQRLAKLAIQSVEIAEGADEKEVRADISERPLDFALGLGAVGPAGARGLSARAACGQRAASGGGKRRDLDNSSP